jgi:LCP family protein required for cell wall assembly
MEYSRYNYRRNRGKRGKVFKSFAVFFIFILLIVGGYLGYIVYKAKEAADKSYEKNPPEVVVKRDIKIKEEPFTMLLIGVEDQEGGRGRSDVLMFVTVNPTTKESYLVSIPRDTRTLIPETGRKDKINHSYSIGGVATTIETIEELLGVPVDYYITTNFNGFEEVVDSLGGVTVDVPFTFKAQLTGSLDWKTYQEGIMELNGNEALAYVRMRKSDPRGDIGRNERQKQVINAIIQKGTSFSSLTKIDNVIEDVGDNVTTNIPPSELLGFVELVRQLGKTETQSLTLEGYDEYINDIYYYIPNESSINEINTTLTGVLSSSGADLTQANQ